MAGWGGGGRPPDGGGVSLVGASLGHWARLGGLWRRRADAAAEAAAAIGLAVSVLRGFELLEQVEGAEWQPISVEGAWEPLHSSWAKQQTVFVEQARVPPLAELGRVTGEDGSGHLDGADCVAERRPPEPPGEVSLAPPAGGAERPGPVCEFKCARAGRKSERKGLPGKKDVLAQPAVGLQQVFDGVRVEAVVELDVYAPPVVVGWCGLEGVSCGESVRPRGVTDGTDKGKLGELDLTMLHAASVDVAFERCGYSGGELEVVEATRLTRPAACDSDSVGRKDLLAPLAESGLEQSCTDGEFKLARGGRKSKQRGFPAKKEVFARPAEGEQQADAAPLVGDGAEEVSICEFIKAGVGRVNVQQGADSKLDSAVDVASEEDADALEGAAIVKGMLVTPGGESAEKVTDCEFRKAGAGRGDVQQGAGIKLGSVGPTPGVGKGRLRGLPATKEVFARPSEGEQQVNAAMLVGDGAEEVSVCELIEAGVGRVKVQQGAVSMLDSVADDAGEEAAEALEGAAIGQGMLATPGGKGAEEVTDCEFRKDGELLKRRWCDLAAGDDGWVQDGVDEAAEAMPAQVDMQQLRAMVESAIGYELLGITLEEGSAEEASELLLQLPVHGIWNLDIAQAALRAAGKAGVRGPVYTYGMQ